MTDKSLREIIDECAENCEDTEDGIRLLIEAIKGKVFELDENTARDLIVAQHERRNDLIWALSDVEVEERVNSPAAFVSLGHIKRQDGSVFFDPIIDGSPRFYFVPNASTDETRKVLERAGFRAAQQEGNA